MRIIARQQRGERCATTKAPFYWNAGNQLARFVRQPTVARDMVCAEGHTASFHREPSLAHFDELPDDRLSDDGNHATSAHLQASPRYAIPIRAAKLIADQDEFLCII